MEINLSNNSAITIVPFATIEDLASELAPALTSGTVALSGGSTYEKLFKAWAKMDLNLSDNWYCAADERVVPFEDQDSNWGTASRELFTPLEVPEQRNNHYNTKGFFLSLLRNRFDTEVYNFDTIFLGVGDDGHTASLFPGSPALQDMDSVVVETKSPKGVRERISLAPKAIKDAKNVITVLTGEGKEECVKWLKEGDMSKPFVSMLALREHSTLYMDKNLFSFLNKL